MFSANSSQVSDDKLFVEDVFSTYLYTGNGSTGQSITNSVDLAGKGGLVWIKRRNVADDHDLTDTVRGAYKPLRSNSTAAQSTETVGVSAFNSNGFTLAGAGGTTNASGSTYASWTFREAPKFFDVVTFTSNSAAGASFSHSLGSSPGMVIIKCTSQSQAWLVWHRGISTDKLLYLNTTDAQQNVGVSWISVSDTNVTIIDGMLSNTQTYVAYLFAHDTTSDGIIQCGSFTTDGSAEAKATVELGWEPQWVLVKRSSGTGNWNLLDTMRGWSQSSDARLYANTSGEEFTALRGNPTATGFVFDNESASSTYIYIAIRRGPMRTPTSGTSVFSPIARTGTGAAASITGAGFPPDALFSNSRTQSFNNTGAFSRLTGVKKILMTNDAIPESDDATGLTSFDQNGFSVGTDADNGTLNRATSYIHWLFRRAPSFFDVVCYTGTGVARTINHNLGVAPELMIVKRRTGDQSWSVYNKDTGVSSKLYLNFNFVPTSGDGEWNNTAPTASVFSVGINFGVNGSGNDYVAYLFASCPGVSKVGSYTGNGSSQTINCGFAAGARFVMIKRTDSTGDWYVWDSARGIVSGNDPHLSLNSTAAEVTTDDSVDTDSSGFVVNQLSATNINVSSATYIYLAVA